MVKNGNKDDERESQQAIKYVKKNLGSFVLTSYDDCCKIFTILSGTPVCNLVRMNVKFFRGESLVFYGSMALSERETNPCVVKV